MKVLVELRSQGTELRKISARNVGEVVVLYVITYIECTIVPKSVVTESYGFV